MTQWNQPKDEIPGITTYLYEANRSRKPEEYIGFDKRLEYEKKRFLYNKYCFPDSYLEALDELYWANNTIDNDDVHLAETERDEALDKYDELELNYKTAISNLEIYGTHKENCNYLELSAIGRISNEAETCTCGFYQAILEIKKELKKDG